MLIQTIRVFVLKELLLVVFAWKLAVACDDFAM